MTAEDQPLDADEAAGRGLVHAIPGELVRKLYRAGLDRKTAQGLVDKAMQDIAKVAIQLGANADLLAAEKEALPQRGLRVTWAREYGTFIAARCVVGNLIESGSLVLIYGESNTGKSTFAIDLALTCGRGVPWRGRRTRKAIAVYLPLEGARGVRQRVRAKLSRDQDAGLPIPKDLAIPFVDLTGRVNLLDPVGIATLLATLREIQDPTAELILIVDTVARALVGGDENSSQDMGALIGVCDAIRAELGCTVVLIHHAGKDTTKGARGHSSLRAAVDTEIEVTGTVNPRFATVRKQRDLPSGDVFAFELDVVDLGTDPDTFDPVTACVVVHRNDVVPRRKEPSGSNQQAVLGAVRQWVSEHGDIIATPQWHQLCKAQEIRKTQWSRLRASLVDAGWLVECTGGVRYVP